MLSIRLFVIKIFLAISIAGIAQPFAISGRVLDAESGQPLAFVNIVINQGNTGSVSDIDGRFALKSNEAINFLRFSYVGYAQLVYHIQNPDERLVVKMERLSLELPEVIIVAGENPAHRIIENAIRHRNRNNYERLPSFSYTSYDKLIFTLDTDSIFKLDTIYADTSMMRLKEFLDEQHFFIMESVAQRRFLYPSRDHQKVVATRVAGFKDPIFTFLISQLQSTSFYEDVISISDKNYVNPISRGSTARYWFMLEDTMFMAGSPDTTFIISYRPRTNLNFDGLKGILHINSNNWAIQRVIAEPAIQNKGMAIKIQQMYELIDGLYWFPVQLHTELVVKNVLVNDFYPVGQGKSYITDIVVNPTLVRRQFSEVNVDVDPNAAYRTEKEWEQWRTVEMTDKDLRTYHVLDSLGRRHNFDRYALMFESLLSGNIPLGKFDIPMNRLFRYNKHEKVYLGIGLSTNQRISRVFRAGAYAGYGFGDNRFTYGGEMSLNFHRFRDLGWFFRLSNDVAETGKVDPFITGTMLGLSDYRVLLIEKMDHTKTLATGMQYRVLPYLLVNLGLDRSWKSPQYDYFYTATGQEAFPKAYVFTELSAGFRFSYREKILQTSRSRISLGSNYPTFWFRFAQGLEGFLDGQFSFRRFDAKIEQSFYTRFFGKTNLLLRAGMIDSSLPYMQLYSGFGSYAGFTIHSPGSFASMRMNEFAADEYISFYLSHDFGKLLLRTKRFEPEFVVATHAGFGRLSKQETGHHNIALQSFEKGYFESGLLINNLLNLQFFNLGFGAFYRYGPYSRDRFKQNISWRLSMNFQF